MTSTGSSRGALVGRPTSSGDELRERRTRFGLRDVPMRPHCACQWSVIIDAWQKRQAPTDHGHCQPRSHCRGLGCGDRHMGPLSHGSPHGRRRRRAVQRPAFASGLGVTCPQRGPVVDAVVLAAAVGHVDAQGFPLRAITRTRSSSPYGYSGRQSSGALGPLPTGGNKGLSQLGSGTSAGPQPECCPIGAGCPGGVWDPGQPAPWRSQRRDRASARSALAAIR